MTLIKLIQWSNERPVFVNPEAVGSLVAAGHLPPCTRVNVQGAVHEVRGKPEEVALTLQAGIAT